MKRFLFCCSFFAFFASQAQQINPVPDYVFRNQMSVGRNAATDTAAYFSVGPRFGATKGMMPPMVVDTATFSGSKRNGLLIFSVQKNKYLYWDSVRVQWSDMAGSSGQYITGTVTSGKIPKATSSTVITDSRMSESGLLISAPRFKADSMFFLPKMSTTPTDTGAVRYSLTDSTAYLWTGYQWIKTGISKQDTATMLTPYLRNVDTSAMLTSYLRKVDTSSMLTPYLRKVDTSAMLTSYLRKVDTSAMLSSYLRKVDTATMLSPYLRKIDTLTMLSPYVRAAGYGLTKSGQSLLVDTAAMATRARVQKAVDSLGSAKQNTLTNPVTGTGTTNRVAIFTGTSTIGSGSIVDSASAVSMTIIANGTVGIGKQPSQWASYIKTLQVQNTVLTGFTSGTNHIANLGMNFWDNGTNGYYQNDGFASLMQQVSGDFRYYTAPSGTAGNTITFTERMRLTAAGELLLNTTSDAGAYALQVAGSIYNTTGAVFAATSGSVLIATTTNAGFYLDVNGIARTGTLTVNTNGQGYTIATNQASGTAGQNIFLGNAGSSLTGTSGAQSSFNTTLGVNAGNSITTAEGIVAIGHNAMNSTTTANGSTAVGRASQRLNTTGSSNTSLGFQSLENNGTGIQNTAIGTNALRYATSSNSTAVGMDALRSQTSGVNSAFGTNTLSLLTTGDENSAFGRNALSSLTTGNRNVAIGSYALSNATTSSDNVSIGADAGRLIASGGTNTTPANSIYIGSDARPAATGNTNEIVIGYQARGNGSNTVTIGNTSTVGTYVPAGELFVNTSSDAGAYALQVAGSIYNTTGAVFAASSGNVGIGTTSAGSKLTISSASSSYIQVINETTSNSLFLGNNAGNGYIETSGAYATIFHNNGSERMRITSAGEVLVGTTSDAGAFTIQSNAGIYAGPNVNSVALQYPSGSAIRNDGATYFDAGTGGSGNFILRVGSSFATVLTATNSSEVLIATSSDAGAYVLQASGAIYNTGSAAFAVTSGSVSIGTTSAQTALTVQTTGESKANFQGGAGSETGINFGDASNNAIGRIVYNNSGDYMGFFANNAERARINSDGTLLIAATSAYAVQNKLEVYGPVFIRNAALASGLVLDSTRIQQTAINNMNALYVIGSNTGSNSDAMYNTSWTWNTTGNVDAIRISITNTASGASSNYINITDGTNAFKVSKTAAITTGAPSGGTAKPFKIGAAATVSPTSPNRTIEIEIDGTTYYIHAKTTNN